ncbi:MAG: 2'-5' RNA ligase family protein [Chitinophagales bacterium]
MINMYFIALVAPKEINDEVLKWKQLMKERFDCLVALRSPAHITLIPPFWMANTLENELENVITGFSQKQISFEINLKNFSAFKPKVIYIDVTPNESLQRLYLQLQDFLIVSNQFPFIQEDRPFHPHVTIATRDLHKKTFQEAWDIFKEKKYQGSWITNGISLLKHNQKNWDVIFTSQFQ